MKVRRIPHDQRIIATHFKRKDLAGHIRKLAVKRNAGSCGPGEQNPVNTVMGCKCLAFCSAANEHADDATWNTGGMETFNKHSTGCRRFFRWFEYDSIAGDQRGHDMPVGQMGWKIIRAKHTKNPVRFVAQRSLCAQIALKPPL